MAISPHPVDRGGLISFPGNWAGANGGESPRRKKMRKDSQIYARVGAEQAQAIRRAAELLGVDTAEFVRETMALAAQKVLTGQSLQVNLKVKGPPQLTLTRELNWFLPAFVSANDRGEIVRQINLKLAQERIPPEDVLSWSVYETEK